MGLASTELHLLYTTFNTLRNEIHNLKVMLNYNFNQFFGSAISHSSEIIVIQL